MKIKRNKKEFEERAKALSERYDVPLETMKEWLDDAYNTILKKYIVESKSKEKLTKEGLREELEEMLENDLEWICPFCENINKGKTCAKCGAYLSDEQMGDQLDTNTEGQQG